MAEIRPRTRRLEVRGLGTGENGPTAGSEAPPPPRTRTRVQPVADPAQSSVRRTPPPVPAAPRPAAVAAEVVRIPEATITVHRAHYQMGQLIAESGETETVNVPAFVGPVGHVNVTGSVTRNLGNYNGVKVAVSVSLPCYPELSEVRRAYTTASVLIDELIPAEMDKAVGEQPTIGQNTNG
jgi:hypothetical protein